MADPDSEPSSPDNFDLLGLFVFGTDNEQEAFDTEAAHAIKSSAWTKQLLLQSGIEEIAADATPGGDGSLADRKPAAKGSTALDFSEIDELADDDAPSSTQPAIPVPKLSPVIHVSAIPSVPQFSLPCQNAAAPAYMDEDDYDEEDASQHPSSGTVFPFSQPVSAQLYLGSNSNDILNLTQPSSAPEKNAADDRPKEDSRLDGQESQDAGVVQEETTGAGLHAGTAEAAVSPARGGGDRFTAADKELEELDPEKKDILKQLRSSILAHNPTEDILWFSELFPSYEAEDVPSDEEQQHHARSQQLSAKLNELREQRQRKNAIGARTESQSLELAILDGRDDEYDESNIMQQVLDDFELVQLQAQLQTQTELPHSQDGTILDLADLYRHSGHGPHRTAHARPCGFAGCRFHAGLDTLEAYMADVGGSRGGARRQRGKVKEANNAASNHEQAPFHLQFLFHPNLVGTVNTYDWEQDINWSDTEEDSAHTDGVHTLASPATVSSAGVLHSGALLARVFPSGALPARLSRAVAKHVMKRDKADGGEQEGKEDGSEDEDVDVMMGIESKRGLGKVDGLESSAPVMGGCRKAAARIVSMPVILEPLSRPAIRIPCAHPSVLRIQGATKHSSEDAAKGTAPAVGDVGDKEKAAAKEDSKQGSDEERKTEEQAAGPDGMEVEGPEGLMHLQEAAAAEAPSTAAPASAKLQLPPELQRPYLSTLQQPTWLSAVSNWYKQDKSVGDSITLDFIPSRVSLDLNNPQLIFEASSSAPMNKLKKAAALVLPPPPQVRLVAGPPVADNEVAKELARFNISKDHEYSVAHNKRTRGMQLCRHSVPALTLLTLPLRQTVEERTNFHRPRSVWLPPKDTVGVKLKLKKLHKDKDVHKEATPKLELTFKTLGGESAKVTVHDCEHTLQHYWDKAKSKLELEDMQEQPRLLDNRLRELDLTATLTANQLAATSTLVHVLYQEVQLLPSRQSNALPEQGEQATRPLRPPAAFTKAKDLTATEGHLLLLEYTDERPLLLSQVGMGVRLLTHYKKRSNADNALESFIRSINQAHQTDKVLSKLDPYSKGQWQYGMASNLSPDDDITYLGHLEQGKHMLAVECQLFKAPAAAHFTTPTDFLLIRHPSGLMQLREFTGSITVGQEQPEVRVQPPEQLPQADEARFVVKVLRELRKKQRRLQGQAAFPDLKVQKIAVQLGLPESSIAMLKDRCFCRSEVSDDAHFVLKANATIPEEEKLREMCPPEVVCAAESSRAAIASLQKEGVLPWGTDENGMAYLYRELTGIPPEKWQLLAEMLPQDPMYAQCAAYLEVVLQLCPWALTDNFISSHKEQKAGTYLALIGPGDPSGRGLAFSYVREVRRVQKDANQVAKEVEAKGITGTSADLRRMTTQQAHKALLELGLKEEDFSNLDRWRCIGLVRELSSAAAQDGRADLAKYARTTRVPPWEQHKRYQTKYQNIFDRHLKALQGGALGKDIAIIHPLVDISKPVQAAPTTAEAPAGKTGSKSKASSSGPTEAEEREALKELMMMMKDEEVKDNKEEGLVKVRAPKLEARPGDRRIRRTIRYPDGTTREWILPKSESREKQLLFESVWGSIPASGRRVKPTQNALALPGLGSLKARSRSLYKEEAPPSAFRQRASSRAFHKSKRPRISDDPELNDDYKEVLQEFEEDEETLAALNAGRRSKSARLNTHESMDLVSTGVALSSGAARRSTSSASKGRGGPTSPSATTASLDSARTESGGQLGDVEILSPESRSRRPAPKRGGRKAGGNMRSLNTVAARHGPASVEMAAVNPEYQRRLNELLKAALSDLVKKDKLSFPGGKGVFKAKVPVTHVKDYHTWVPKEDEMYLDKVGKKISSNKYQSVQDFRKDVKQIHINSERYNTPGHGLMAEQSFVVLAQQLAEFCNEKLEAMKDEIAAVEAMLSGGPGSGHDNWIECEGCKKWRKVSDEVYAEYEAHGSAEWQCNMDFDRPEASCNVPCDYASANAGVMG